MNVPAKQGRVICRRSWHEVPDLLSPCRAPEGACGDDYADGVATTRQSSPRGLRQEIGRYRAKFKGARGAEITPIAD